MIKFNHFWMIKFNQSLGPLLGRFALPVGRENRREHRTRARGHNALPHALPRRLGAPARTLKEGHPNRLDLGARTHLKFTRDRREMAGSRSRGVRQHHKTQKVMSRNLDLLAHSGRDGDRKLLNFVILIKFNHFD